MARGRPPEHNRALPTCDDIQPTRELTAVESAMWGRWKDVIRATRPFLPTDAPSLTDLIDLECRKARASAALAKVDPYETGKRHPALTDWDNAHRDSLAIRRELGLTAASMKNVNMGERKSKEADALGEFIEGGG